MLARRMRCTHPDQRVDTALTRGSSRPVGGRRMKLDVIRGAMRSDVSLGMCTSAPNHMSVACMLAIACQNAPWVALMGGVSLRWAPHDCDDGAAAPFAWHEVVAVARHWAVAEALACVLAQLQRQR